MQDVVEDNAKGDMHVEGLAFAVHGQENGRITHPQRCFGDAVVFVAHDQAGFLGVGEGVVGNGRIRQFHRHNRVARCFELLQRGHSFLLIAPGDA